MARSPTEIVHIILSAAWRRRYLICLPIVILPPIAFVAGGFVSEVYETRMTLLVQEPAKLNPFLNDLAIGPNLKERMPALNSLVHSEHVLGKVLEDVGVLDAESSRGKREQAVRGLSSAIKARLVGSDLVELSIRRREKEGLVQTLEAVSKRFLERLLAPERSSLSDSQSFLKSQLDERRSALRAVENQLAGYKQNHADKLPAVYSANVTRLTSMRQKLDDKVMELAAADAAFNDMRERLITTNPLIGQLEEGIVEVSGELSTLRARYTDQHSAVQAAESKLKRLQGERQSLMESSKSMAGADLDRLWNMAASTSSKGDTQAMPLLVSQMERLQEAQGKRAALRQDVDQLSKSIAELQASTAESGPIEQEVQRLEREILMAREMYESLNKRYEMARVTGALGKFEGPERVKIIDIPVAPVSPVTPGRMLFLIVGIFAGIGLGGGLAAVAEIFDTRIRRAKDFYEFTDLPIITRLPRGDTGPAGFLAAPIIEATRLPGLHPTIDG